MMFRTIDCATWDDPWFADLAPDAKLLFLYLLTNRRTTACGAFEITMRQISFETGLAQTEIAKLLQSLEPKVIWWPSAQIVWLRNFYRRQVGNSNADKYRISAQRSLAELPIDVQVIVVGEYPDLECSGYTLSDDTDTLSIPITKGTDTLTRANRDRDNNKDIDIEKDKDTSDAIASAVGQPFTLLEALCNELGQDVSVLSGNQKTKQLGVAKRLVAAGLTEPDLRRMVHWLSGQTWMTSGVDLFTVDKYLSKWQLAGKPEVAASAINGASPNKHGPKGPSAAYFAEMARDLERQGR